MGFSAFWMHTQTLSKRVCVQRYDSFNWESTPHQHTDIIGSSSRSGQLAYAYLLSWILADSFRTSLS